MTDAKPARRSWTRWAVVALLILLIWVLYPQLKDFGGEIYRLFG